MKFDFANRMKKKILIISILFDFVKKILFRKELKKQTPTFACWGLKVFLMKY